MTHIMRIDEMDKFNTNESFTGIKTTPTNQNRWLNRKKDLTDGCIVSFGNSSNTTLGFGVYVDYKKHQEWIGNNFQNFNHNSQNIVIHPNDSEGGFITVTGGGRNAIVLEYNYIPIEDYGDNLNGIPYIYDETIDIEKTPIGQLENKNLKELVAGVEIISSMFGK